MPEQNEQLQQFAAENNIVPTENKPPEVLLPDNGGTITQTGVDIFTAIKPSGRFFYRMDAIAELVRDPNGTAKFKLLTTPAARTAFEPYVRFIKQTAKGKVGGILPKDIAEAVLHCSAARDILPHIRYLSQSPVLVEENGQLRMVTGMDEATGIYVSGGDVQRPGDLKTAVQLIETMLSDFIFENESDSSRAVAAILTPALVQGGLLESAPVFYFEADRSQAGKGYQVELNCALYREQPYIITQKTGGVGSFDETLGSALFSGRSFIFLDNFRLGLNSMHFESIVTAKREVSVRMPYSAAIDVDTRRRIFFLTSNGMKMTEDMVNRLCTIRIKKDDDLKPISIEGKSILEIVREQQPAFLGAVHTIIEEWHKRGKQRTNEGRHSFREWAQSMDWIVQNIFELPPLLDGHDGVEEGLSALDLTFIDHLSRSVALDEAGLEYQTKDLAMRAQAHTIPIPKLKEDAKDRTSAGAKLIGGIMAELFKDQPGPTTEHGTWHRVWKDIPSPNGRDPYSGWIYTFQKKDVENPRPPLPPNPMKQSG